MFAEICRKAQIRVPLLRSLTLIAALLPFLVNFVVGTFPLVTFEQGIPLASLRFPKGLCGFGRDKTSLVTVRENGVTDRAKFPNARPPPPPN